MKSILGNVGTLLSGQRHSDVAAVGEMRRPEYEVLPDFAPLPDTVLSELAAGKLEVLTKEGGTLEVAQHLRSYVCVFADGTIVVSNSHKTHPIISKVLRQMRREGLELFEAYCAPLTTVAEFYGRGDRSVVASSDFEQMQKNVFRLLEEACDMGATDILIRVTSGLTGSGSAVIRVCINETWRHLRDVSGEFARLFLASAYNLANVQDGVYKENDYQMARISTPDVPLPRNLESVRLQFGPVAGYGRFCVMRLLFARSGGAGRKTLVDLGYDPEHITSLRRIRNTPFGVMFMTGPTGSGKSTTLAVSLEQLFVEREEKINIVTVEDPPEYEIRGATQLPIANVITEDDRRLAFVTAFNSVLRMKPHVIMVGEVRDKPAAELLFKAAQSGHAVFSSIHCKSAIGTAVRIHEMGIDRYLVSDSSLLIGMAFQRLIPKLCKHCCLAYNPRDVEPEVANMIHVVCSGDTSSVRLRNRDGCKVCNKDWRSDPGHSGQTVIAEVLQPDDDILLATLDGRRREAMEMWLADPTALTAFEHGLRKAMRGEVDPRDVFQSVFDRQGLSRLMDQPGRRMKVRGEVPINKQLDVRDLEAPRPIPVRAPVSTPPSPMPRSPVAPPKRVDLAPRAARPAG